MIQEYSLYSKNDLGQSFIGFVVIAKGGLFYQATILLFETIAVANRTDLYQQSSITERYNNLELTENEIIVDIFIKKVPNFRTSGLEYYAIDSVNHSDFQIL